MGEINTKYPIAVTPEIQALLDSNVPVAIGVSGGKDSHALAFRLTEYLDEIGHQGARLLIHSDLGRIEWKDSLPVAQRIAKRLNMDLEVVRRKAGDLIDRFETRFDNNIRRYHALSCVKLILPWSTPGMRFCTSELKTALISSKLKVLYPRKSIISVTGVRAAESAARAKAPIAQVQPKLTGKGFAGWDWRPIHSWPTEDVFSYLKSKGEVLHEAYTRYGCSRVSCSFCIMGSANDLKAAAACPSNTIAYRMLVGLEIRSTFAYQGSRWLGDVAPHLLSAEMRDALVGAKERARKRVEAEARIPKYMLFEKGWPTRIPTLEEAQLLGEVRKTVCASIGMQPTFTEVPEIIARYEALMAEKQHGKSGDLFEAAA